MNDDSDSGEHSPFLDSEAWAVVLNKSVMGNICYLDCIDSGLKMSMKVVQVGAGQLLFSIETVRQKAIPGGLGARPLLTPISMLNSISLTRFLENIFIRANVVATILPKASSSVWKGGAGGVRYYSASTALL